MSTTTGQAATYQRLRQHLDFLKLPAAAEALPGILDAARAEDASTVTVLEQLLAVEVETTQARRLASRLRFACLPTQSSLDTFDFTAQPGVDEKTHPRVGIAALPRRRRQCGVRRTTRHR